MTFDMPSAAVLDWIGYVGVAFYLGSYAALQLGLIRGSSATYAVANLLAASFVLVSLFNAFNMSAALIQVFWIIISLIGLARILFLARMIRISPQEQRFIDGAFGTIPRQLARRILDQGQWVASPPGTVLLDEGAPVANLFYILDGHARVSAAGQMLGEVTGGFVGEINVMSGGPASARVETGTDCTVFVLPGPALQRLAKRDSDFRLILETALSRELGRKLIQANDRLAAAQ